MKTKSSAQKSVKKAVKAAEKSQKVAIGSVGGVNWEKRKKA